MDKVNIILADCEREELDDFSIGLEKSLGQKFKIKSKICNGKHNIINNIYRYIIYAIYPFRIFIKRKKCNIIFGWQQFFSLFYVFYCNLFRVKKRNIVVVGNFTYKQKKGFLGKIYLKFMKYCLNSKHLDYIHVPSENYAKECALNFNISIEKFIVTTFGLPDTYNQWKNSKVDYKDYTLAIGRSNRDYDFLIEAWKKISNKHLLIIISDQYKLKGQLPDNIIIKNNVTGNEQFPYIINCKLMIVPINDGSICSGDTVLLKAMCYYKPIIVTTPSTLSEMYIEDNVNGICLDKNVEMFSKKTEKLLNDYSKLQLLGKNARDSYEKNFSRYHMGMKIGENIMLKRDKFI